MILVTFNGHDTVLGTLLVLWCAGSGMWTIAHLVVWLLSGLEGAEND